MCNRLMDWMGSPPRSSGSCQGVWRLRVARGPCIRSSSPLGLPWPNADVSDASASRILPLLASSRRPRLADCSVQRGESYSRSGVNEKSNHPVPGERGCVSAPSACFTRGAYATPRVLASLGALTQPPRVLASLGALTQPPECLLHSGRLRNPPSACFTRGAYATPLAIPITIA